MKKLKHTILAAIILIATTLSASAQHEQSRKVSGFRGIAAGGPFSVHVKIEGTESLTIIAEKDLIDDIETVVENGILKIKFKHDTEWNHHNPGKIEVRVTAKSLSSLSNAGSGSIKLDGTLTGEKASVSIAGSGNITAAVQSASLHGNIAGSGSLNLNGKVEAVKIAIEGSGNVNAKELKAGTVSVAIAGSGNVYVNAEKTVSASIAGSGNVIYSGNATISNSHTAGSGRIVKE